MQGVAPCFVSGSTTTTPCVPVNYQVHVQVLDGFQNLQNVVLGFFLREALAPPHELHQRLVLAQIQDNVHIVVVLKVRVESYDATVVQSLVDDDLRLQLLNTHRVEFAARTRGSQSFHQLTFSRALFFFKDDLTTTFPANTFLWL